MSIPQEAIEAQAHAAWEICNGYTPEQWDDPPTESMRELKQCLLDEYAETLQAAWPALEKAIRAEIAAEIRYAESTWNVNATMERACYRHAAQIAEGAFK